MSEYKPYTGIGSRETPPLVLQEMTALAYTLRDRGWTLRTGGAEGADSAFYMGARLLQVPYGEPEVYLPWPNFQGFTKQMAKRSSPQPEAFEIAERFHPRWQYLKQGAQKLHARNVHQVLGRDVIHPDLSRFIVCWTPGGKGGGGTGQALRIAKHYALPIFDLGSAQYLNLTTTELTDILPL